MFLVSTRGIRTATTWTATTTTPMTTTTTTTILLGCDSIEINLVWHLYDNYFSGNIQSWKLRMQFHKLCQTGHPYFVQKHNSHQPTRGTQGSRGKRHVLKVKKRIKPPLLHNLKQRKSMVVKIFPNKKGLLRKLRPNKNLLKKTRKMKKDRLCCRPQWGKVCLHKVVSPKFLVNINSRLSNVYLG